MSSNAAASLLRRNYGYLKSATVVFLSWVSEAPLKGLTRSLEFETLALSEGVADSTVPLDKARERESVAGLVVMIARCDVESNPFHFQRDSERHARIIFVPQLYRSPMSRFAD